LMLKQEIRRKAKAERKNEQKAAEAA